MLNGWGVIGGSSTCDLYFYSVSHHCLKLRPVFSLLSSAFQCTFGFSVFGVWDWDTRGVLRSLEKLIQIEVTLKARSSGLLLVVYVLTCCYLRLLGHPCRNLFLY